MIRAIDTLRERLGTLRPQTAIILGSSLGPVADAVTAPLRIPYRDLPGFPVPKISGHSGEVFAGCLHGKPVVVLRGRGHPPQLVLKVIATPRASPFATRRPTHRHKFSHAGWSTKK